LNAEPRIGEAMYLCKLSATQFTYGTCYNIIEKSRGKVISEEVQEGTNDFLIEAHIPLVEGFKFADDIRSATQGSSYPQLVFHGFEVNVDNDPLYLPLSEEDLEDYGEGLNLVENIARQLIERVRR
jgi:ribosome assembly protein 1